jgi:hypothetical protein
MGRAQPAGWRGNSPAEQPGRVQSTRSPVRLRAITHAGTRRAPAAGPTVLAMTADPPVTRDSMRLSELMAAWSVAIDVGLAAPLETGLRVCARAVRLAERLDLDDATRRRVYYLALLRHIGCTAENTALAGFLGDEIAFRAGLGTRDVSSGAALLPHLLRTTVGVRPFAQRPATLLRTLARAGVLKEAGAAVGEVARA